MFEFGIMEHEKLVQQLHLGVLSTIIISLHKYYKIYFCILFIVFETCKNEKLYRKYNADEDLLSQIKHNDSGALKVLFEKYLGFMLFLK